MKVSTMADERTQEMMVPIASAPNHCPLAYLPGYIKHTNELLVLLGDNWFVERTAKQSIEIIDRRVKKVDEMISEINKEKEQYESWIKMTDEIMGEQKGVEIIEEYDEEKERIWREKHRESVRAQKKLEAEQRNSLSTVDTLSEELDESDHVDQSMKTVKLLESKRKKSVTFDLSSIDESLEIVSEKDVYPLPKPSFSSICKETTSLNDAEETKRPNDSRFDHNLEAFSGVVKERIVHSSSEKPLSDQQNKNKKVSKFKASRS